MPRVGGPTIVYSADVKQLIKAADEAKAHVSRLAKGLKDGSTSTKDFNHAVRAAKNAMTLKNKALREAKTQTSRADKETKKFTKTINSYRVSLGRLASISVVLQGAAGAIRGVYQAVERVQGVIRRSADDANEILQAANTVSLGTEEFQEWGIVIQDAGGELTHLREAFYTLGIAMRSSRKETGRHADIFKEVGLSSVDAAGYYKETSDFLLEVSTKLKELGESGQIQRLNELAGATFGEEFAKRFTGILRQGGSELENVFKDLREQGLITSDETIRKLAAFRTALIRIGIQTKVVLRQIIADDGQKFLEMFQTMANLAIIVARNFDKILFGIEALAPVILGLIGLKLGGPGGLIVGGLTGAGITVFLHSQRDGPIDYGKIWEEVYGRERPIESERPEPEETQLDFTELNRVLSALAALDTRIYDLILPTIDRDTQAGIDKSVESVNMVLRVVDLGARKEIERLEVLTDSLTKRAQAIVGDLPIDRQADRDRYFELLDAIELYDELFRGFETSLADREGFPWQDRLIEEWRQRLEELPESDIPRTVFGDTEDNARRVRFNELLAELAEAAITNLSEAIVSLFESARSAADAIRSLIRQVASLSTEFLVRELFLKTGLTSLPEAAMGGPVRGITLVGEHGPEIVDFRRPGRVYPTNELTAAMGQTGQVQVNLSVNLNGQVDRNDIDQATPQLAEMVRGVVTDALSGRGDMRAVI